MEEMWIENDYYEANEGFYDDFEEAFNEDEGFDPYMGEYTFDC